MFASIDEVNAIIAEYPWECRLVHSNGSAESFTAFLAKWGRSGWQSWNVGEYPAAINRYVLLGLPTCPKAAPGERMEAVRSELTKIMIVQECEILDWKVEYTCEEIT